MTARSEPTHPGAGQTRVVACHGCGAPLTLQLSATTIRCTHCGTERTLEEAERARLQAVAAELRETDGISNAADELRRRLLRPTIVALFSGGWLETLALLFWIYLGWGLGFVAGELLGRPGVYERGNTVLGPAVLLWLPTILLCFSIYALLRARRLRALRTAVAAVRGPQGEALSCRLCGAPLPAARSAERAFSRCSFCGAHNLLSLDAVGRRESWQRQHQERRLERLRTAEVKIRGGLGWLVFSLGALPIAVGIALHPLHDAAMARVAPLLPAPPQPGPWSQDPMKLALLVPEDESQPWPIVHVEGILVEPQMTVRHGSTVETVAADELRSLPLRSGLRLVRASQPQAPAGIIDESELIRFRDDLGRYVRDRRSIQGLAPVAWTAFSVVPEWTTGSTHDDYFDFQRVEPLATDALELIRPSPAERKGPPGSGFARDRATYRWARSVELVSSETDTPEHGARQALGPPDVFPQHEQSSRAWSPARAAAAREWITVSFGSTHRAKGVVVFETLRGGALVAIDDCSLRARCTPLWKGELEPADQARVAVLPLGVPRAIAALRIVLEPRRVPGSTAIDAIGLVVR